MATKIESSSKVHRNLAYSPEVVYALLEDIERSVGACFPDLAELKHLRDRRYLHRLKPIGAMGLTLNLHWETDYFRDPETKRVWWTADPKSGNSGLDGEIKLVQTSSGVTMQFEAKFWVWLSIPSLMSGMARPVAQRLLDEMVNRYVANLDMALEQAANP